MERILFLCTSDHSYTDIKEATGKISPDISVEFSEDKTIPALQEIIAKARPAAIIAPPITADYIKTHTKKPCIAMFPSQFDLLDLLMRARYEGSDTVYYIGFNHTALKSDQAFLERMLGKKLVLVTYSEDREKYNAADKLDGLSVKRVAVTSGWVAERMREKGIEPVLLRWNESSVHQALNTAAEVIKQTRREAKFNIWLNATLNNVTDGIIGTQQGSVFTFNKKASEFFGINSSEIIGKSITQIDKDSTLGRLLKHSPLTIRHEFIHNIRGRLCMVSVIPIAARQTILIIKDKTDINKLHESLSKVAEKHVMVARYEFHDIPGSSQAINVCKELARKYSKSSVPVLILGETGVGKELFAHSIHNASDRSSKPFISMNCSSLSENMMEAELFGFGPGSSSAAAKSGKIGLIELANGGTLFLDEIGELPLKIQSRLLSVIQNKEMTHVSGSVSIPVDVRIISSSNQDLNELVDNKLFRKDLYYRLSTLTLTIPPLRERKEDIPLLAKALYAQKSEEYGKKLPPMPAEFIEKLTQMQWPGNTRELQSFIERYVILASEDGPAGRENKELISHILGESQEQQTPADAGSPPSQLTLDVMPLKDMETDIVYKLSRYYNDTELSKVLDIGRSTIWRKLKEKRS